MADHLIVFAKSPRPGEVKTRLAAGLGSALAAALYRAVAEQVLAQTAMGDGRCPRTVFFAPADAGPEMAAWLPAERCRAQEGADLGARMAAAFAWAFAAGAAKVVLIGTDVPALSAEHVDAAREALDTHDVALGPARDGGYYLVALRRPVPALFEGVPWSTPDVLAETLARVRAAGLGATTLGALGDLDDVEDLRREWPELRGRLARKLVDAVEGRRADLRRP
jgi:rSAM/selenodomain-associated transferase 1